MTVTAAGASTPITVTPTAGTALQPAMPATTGGGGYAVTALSQASLDRLHAAGVSDDVIAIADSVVGAQRIGTAPTSGTTTAPIGTSPIPPDQMDSTYPALTARHVAIFRALQLPEYEIGSMNTSKPTGGEVEAGIQQIAANPDSLDDVLKRPHGTTAALLQQIPPALIATPNNAGPAPEPNGPVDKPDATYPSMTATDVAVLRATGTPERLIESMSKMSAVDVDQYIMNQIRLYPEQWDAYCGTAQGTTRAGLEQVGLLPKGSAQTYPPGTAPGAVAKPKSNALKYGLLAIGAAGLSFLAWKYLHKAPPPAALEAAEDGVRMAATESLGGGGVTGGLAQLVEAAPNVPLFGVQTNYLVNPVALKVLGVDSTALLAALRSGSALVQAVH